MPQKWFIRIHRLTRSQRRRRRLAACIKDYVPGVRNTDANRAQVERQPGRAPLRVAVKRRPISFQQSLLPVGQRPSSDWVLRRAASRRLR